MSESKTTFHDIPREEILDFQRKFGIGRQAFQYRLSVMALKYLDLKEESHEKRV